MMAALAARLREAAQGQRRVQPHASPSMTPEAEQAAAACQAAPTLANPPRAAEARARRQRRQATPAAAVPAAVGLDGFRLERQLQLEFDMCVPARLLRSLRRRLRASHDLAAAILSPLIAVSAWGIAYGCSGSGFEAEPRTAPHVQRGPGAPGGLPGRSQRLPESTPEAHQRLSETPRARGSPGEPSRAFLKKIHFRPWALEASRPLYMSPVGVVPPPLGDVPQLR